MKPKKTNGASSAKVPTGIDGFDEITGGGLPRGRTTLLEGGPGSGKSIMALQSLVNGARLHDEPGIFVAFEESPERITANASKFGWDLPTLQKDKIFFLDARPTPDIFRSGNFDLSGMLAALDAKVRQIKAKRIVFDAMDVVLALMENPAAERKEIYRLNEWLFARGLTAIITSKIGGYENDGANQPQLGFMQFMVDCAVVLNHEVAGGISQRNLRVVKYRGTAFSENESPFLISGRGLEVAGSNEMGRTGVTASTERVSTGVKRLDVMLGGGYFRDASILITGAPGTAKSTLSGAFSEAACERGERTLFVSFDSDANEVVRNLASVHIRLERFVKKGLLRLVSARTITGSAEIHLMQIKSLARDHGARCVVIDPVSAFANAGSLAIAHSVAERLIDWTKASGITLVCTSLLSEAVPDVESGRLQISTIADTWIHLSHMIKAGERNRGLSIVKSRGTSHSNQVRELVLSGTGVTLADAYTAGGEVLMGTMRWEKESAVRASRVEGEAMAKLKQVTLESEEAELEVRLIAVQHALEAKKIEKRLLGRVVANRGVELASNRSELRELRGVDKK